MRSEVLSARAWFKWKRHTVHFQPPARQLMTRHDYYTIVPFFHSLSECIFLNHVVFENIL